MDFEEPTPRKRSLGVLRKAKKTKDRSRDVTGQLTLQREDFEWMAGEFSKTGGQEITCNIAAWPNHDSHGLFLTVQISPRYVPRQKQTTSRPDLDYFFNGGEEI
jgi:hypothetical protein